MLTQELQKNNLSICRILYGNAVISAISGILFLLAAQQISAFLGFNVPWVMLDLGLVAVGYAVLIYFATRQPVIARGFVLFTVIADSTWVVVSILLLLTGWVPFTVEGQWTVGIAAMIVDVFATLQFLAWRKM